MNNWNQNVLNALIRLDHWLEKARIFDLALVLKQKDSQLQRIHMPIIVFRRVKLAGVLFAIGLCFALFGVLFSHLSIIVVVASALGLGLIGWIIPELYIQDRVKTQQLLLNQAVPTFLEQFHMLSSSAGYESFGQALDLIAPHFPGKLGEELRLLVKTKPFLTETELLDRISQICSHPLLNELVVSVKVSTQYGTALADKTAHLVDAAQQLREQQTKELANKTSGVLLGPLLIFHLPALLIIFLIPFLYTLQKGF
jgi:tight adherence protein C